MRIEASETPEPERTRIRWEEPLDVALAIVTALAALVVYVLTLTPTVPFWDGGEFIATSYILGIPHPPGTPLYVLLGRCLSLLPLGGLNVAQKVNLLSAIPSAIAVGLTYLVTARIAANAGPPFGRDRTWPRRPDLIGRVGAFIGALVMAFSDTFWVNAIEAEVYALSSMVMVATVYLILKWRDLRHQGGEDAAHANDVVVVVFYMLALSIAFHMGVFIVFLPLVLYFLSDYYDSLKEPRFVATAITLVVMSFFLGFDSERLVLGAAFIGALLVLNVHLIGRANLATLGVSVGALVLGVLIARSGGGAFGLGVVAVLVAAVLGVARGTLVRRNLMFWILAMFVLGLSVHLFLLIRAGLDPAINEGDPSTLKNFWLVLSRDQYKPAPPWELRATWANKLDTHFWRYWSRQYVTGVPILWALPFVVGALGGAVNLLRARRSGLLMAFIILVTSLGLVWHLNFQDQEVRDRDYFFVSLFHFFAVWIGLGMAGLLYLVGEAVPGRRARAAAMGAVALALVGHPIAQLEAGWFEHDRSRFYVARDYAYNILEPLERDAILFTNGDNDTFPLWYLQEVEGIRRDVRVANLSLLSTSWYIEQLRDTEPRVPIAWDDATIESLYPYIDPDGQLVSVRDLAVVHILSQNRWRRPVYFAVTVPNDGLLGLDTRSQLVMEGMVWRVVPEPVALDVDEERLRNNLENVFLWRGLLDEHGDLDKSIYRDENTMKLSQNYAVAYMQLGRAVEARARKALTDGDEATYDDLTREEIDLLERAAVFQPGFSYAAVLRASLLRTIGDLPAAEAAFTEILAGLQDPEDPSDRRFLPELHYHRGEVRYDLGRYADALVDYDVFARANPGDWVASEAEIRTLAVMGRMGAARERLESWLAGHPNHQLARDMQALLEEGAYRADSSSAPEE